MLFAKMSPVASSIISAILAFSSFAKSDPSTLNVVSPSTSGAISGIKYSHVGTTGTYQQVTDLVPGTFPTCSANPSCVKQTKSVSGPLAPFDEEFSLVFRGPMSLHNVAVYQPSNSSGATWKQVSSYSNGGSPNNLVFLNNQGGGASGEWSICGGSSLSYSSGTFSNTVATPNAQSFSLDLTGEDEINIASGTSCKDVPCDGFARGTSYHGWSGSKAFVLTFDMAAKSAADQSKPPALWALNTQVLNSAQYGCNCRGSGVPGGCGEFDIFEVLPTNLDHAISEIYGPSGATGTGNNNWFARPTSATTIIVIFDMQTDSIMIQKLMSWDYTQGQVSRSVIDAYLNNQAMQVNWNGGNKGRRHMMGSHRRHH